MHRVAEDALRAYLSPNGAADPRNSGKGGSPRSRSAPGEIAGWGNVKVPGTEVRSEELRSVARGSSLTRGLGRSYGDSSLPAPGDLEVTGSALADRILSFDADTGVLRAEAGLTLLDMNRVFLARGWSTPVSPGTKFVTLGGMVASDVHGKNHHWQGTFGEHVRALGVCLADGRVVECSPQNHPDLFWATIGGMGLTGHILEVECVLERIPSPWVWRESRRIADLDEFVDALDSASEVWPFTMGWVDCLSRGRAMGRGILMCGRWADPDEAPAELPGELRKITVPFMLPGWAINPYSVRAFNELYYRAHPRQPRTGIVHPDKFFYPLDAIHSWNRVYGTRGFTQYQCVLPEGDPEGRTGPASRNALRELMELLTASGAASPLCVIKNCGDEGTGMLSFPRRGISVAADFPVTSATPALVDALNELVISHGGRIYLTKDTFTRGDHFRAMEPRLPAWQEVRRRWDPDGRLRSHQSVRLFGEST